MFATAARDRAGQYDQARVRNMEWLRPQQTWSHTEGMNGMLDFGGNARGKRDHLHSVRKGCGSNCRLNAGRTAQCRSTDDCYLLHVRRNFLEQLQPFCSHLRPDVGETCNIAAGMFQAPYEALTDRVDNIHEHDWN